MPGVIPRLQNQENYLKQRYAKYMPEVILRLQIKATILGKDMPNICQRYTNDMLGGIQMLQIQDNYLKQRYAKDMLKICQKICQCCQRYAKDILQIC